MLSTAARAGVGTTLMVLALGLGSARSAAATAPPRVRTVDNGRAKDEPENTSREVPTMREVSSAELAGATRHLAGVLDFADYPFSGCHDRAHATYLGLAAKLGDDAVAKVWLFGPTLLTVALEGAIEASVDPRRWGVTTTQWDYHVAAAVKTADGLQIIDPVLGKINRPMSLETWFDHMRIPPGSAWSLIDGRDYLFHRAGPSEWSGGRRPFNGSMFRYDRSAARERWLPKNLARDAVAVALSEQPAACAELSALIRKPQALVDTVQAMSEAGAPTTCTGFVRTFQEQTENWDALLSNLSVPG